MTIGVNRITVQRWLRKYRSYGLEGLLETKHSGGRKPAIPPLARASLAMRLSDPQKGFKSYGEIQEWLQQEFKFTQSFPLTTQPTIAIHFKQSLQLPQFC